jgi:hypothetical protein
VNQPTSLITTIKRRARSTALAAAAGILVFAVSVYAHGGFDHVMGTVVKVTDNVVTVKTAKGNVDVKVDDKTEITKDNVKAGRAELKPDVRVVFEIPETSKDKVAAAVKIGAGAMAAGDHDEHHEAAGH